MTNQHQLRDDCLIRSDTTSSHTVCRGENDLCITGRSVKIKSHHLFHMAAINAGLIFTSVRLLSDSPFHRCTDNLEILSRGCTLAQKS